MSEQDHEQATGHPNDPQDHSLGRLWAVTARPHAGNRGRRRSPTDDLEFHVSTGQRPNADHRGRHRAQAADESACKPGSVGRRTTEVACRPGDHPSRVAVADNLVRPTRELGRAALERSLSDLAPGGVCRAAQVTLGAGGLLHHRFTLAAGCPTAVCSLWHCPAGHPGWALPTTLPCGARTFLGEQLTVTNHRSHSTRPPGRLVRRADRVAVLRPADVEHLRSAAQLVDLLDGRCTSAIA